MKVKSLGPIRLFATPWTAAYQAPLSMGFSRQEYWSRVPLPSPAVNPNFPQNTTQQLKCTLLWKNNRVINLLKTWSNDFFGMNI